jgi:replicative DNA helicase
MFGDIALASAIEEQRAREGKTTPADFDKLRARLNNHCIKSLQVDLELGLTMAQIAARASRGSEKRERYTLNARKAYLAILRLRGKVVTTAQQSEQLNQKLKQLRMALLDLGERVQSLPMAA